MIDVIIIGGGPAGLYSAFYCGLRGMTVKIIEAQEYLGGKLNVYKEKNIWDIGGVVPQSAEDIISALIKQGNTFDPTIILGEKVTEINNEKNKITVITEDGDVHQAKSLIIATGTGIIAPKKLDFDYPGVFETSNLHYEVQEVESYRDQVVMISGGNDSAVQWAKALSSVAKKIYLVYRKESFRGYETEVESVLCDEKIHCLTEKEISGFKSEKNDKIEIVELKDALTNKKEEFPVDSVIVCHGFERNNPLLDKEDRLFKVVDDIFFETSEKGKTSIPGIYAAGDAASYDGKVRLIAGTFHDAVNAANGVKLIVDPEANERGQVSSHHELLEKRNLEKNS